MNVRPKASIKREIQWSKIHALHRIAPNFIKGDPLAAMVSVMSANRLKRMETNRLPVDDVLPGEPRDRKPPRAWREKFREALRSVRAGIRGQSSFFVHFFLAALVIAGGIALDCGPISWCILLFCIGFVLTAELFNSAIESIFHGLDERNEARCHRSLDIAAGAVLFASITSAVVGGVIFCFKICRMVWPDSVTDIPGW